MYELVQLGEKSYYISSPAKIGVYVAAPDRVYLIDSGSDKDAGRKARQILDANNWSLQGILVTHSNADHIGGCRYLKQQTGCTVFAPGIERAFTEYPILETAFLYGGCPPSDLRHKFLLAQDCACADVTDPAFPPEVEIIPLPGHFFHMTKSAAAAISLFFIAVICVIIGTYLLFTAFSIVFLKRLRANKGYYYKTKHFATVSGMLYRMAVMIALFGSWGALIPPFVLLFAVSELPPWAVLTVFTAAIAAADVLLYRWIVTKGARRFSEMK